MTGKKMGEDEKFHRLEFRLEDSEEKGRSGEEGEAEGWLSLSQNRGAPSCRRNG